MGWRQRLHGNFKVPIHRDVKVLRLTQASVRSFSILLLAQKVLRKLPGSWTLVVVSDPVQPLSRIFAISIFMYGFRVESGDINCCREFSKITI